MKQNELKSLVKEVIRECITEVAPPGAKAERMVHHLKASLAKTHPEWDEEKIKQVAYATAWKHKGEGSVEEAGMTSEDDMPGEEEKDEKEYGHEEYGEDEGEEIKLIKCLGLIIKKLLDMHKGDEYDDENGEEGEEEEEHGEIEVGINEKKDKKWIQKAVDPKHKGYCTPMTKSTCTPKRKALAKRFKRGLEELSESYQEYLNECGPQYKVVSPRQSQVQKDDQAKNVQCEPKVTENHKVQSRTYSTVKDVPQNPENQRDPKKPVAVTEKKK